MMTPDQFDLQQELAISAPFSHALSEHTCNEGFVDASSCDWYHRAWQYLRLLDMVSSPIWHSNFFFSTLESEIENGDNVLISGTADYTMLAPVLRFASPVQNDVEISVLDLCETALILCEWYALVSNQSINTVNENILDIDSSERRYDLIVTDAFLTRFDPGKKPSVVRQWAQLLNEGGVAVTTIRIESKVDTQTGPTDDEARAFAKHARSKVEKRDDFPITPEMMEMIAYEYGANIVSFPIKSPAEAVAIFTENGFETVETQVNTVKGEIDKTKYCQVIARK
jgi:hypothetical protein